MGVASRIADMLRRERLEDTFPPLAVEEGSHLIQLQGEGRHAGFLGGCLMGLPVAGLDATTMDRLRGALSNDIPAGTFIQISLLSTPDIEMFVNAYKLARSYTKLAHLPEETRELLMQFVDNRAQMFLDGKEHPHVAASGVKMNSTTLIVSIKVPTKEPVPTEGEVKSTSMLVSKIQESLATFGLSLERMNAESYLRILRRITHMHESMLETEYDGDLMVRDQILGPGDVVDVSKGNVRINETNIGVLSVRRMPKRARLSTMNYFIGDPRGLGNQLCEPYMMTLTLCYPDQVKKSSKLKRDAQVINYQAYGPMLRWVPRLAYKKHGYDVILQTMEDGAVLVEMNFTLTLFARGEEALERLMSATRTYYGSFGLEMAEERYINWPVFYNTLPLFPSQESIRLLHRYHTMAVHHAINFAPIMSEWRGTGWGSAVLLESRRGQPVLFDLYDSDTNYNGVVFAESGAGKSFVSQQIILDYLSLGARIWVIDVGRSYEKTCKVLGGEYLRFNAESRVCLNPFTEVEDIDEELDLLKSLLAKMAAPTSGVTDLQMAILEEAIKAVWSTRANTMTVTDVSDHLLAQNEKEATELGRLLFPFTRHGSLGSWFDGDNNLDFSKNFVVLELEELNSKKALQQVVLLQLIAKIQHEMFLAKRSGERTPRLMIIDEAWSLLNDGGVATFLEAGYRRFRKQDAAALVITQSIADLYENPAGRPLVENSANKIIMQQLEESITAAQRTGRLAIGDYGFEMLKGVHTVPGKYSELMLYSNNGWGITRLVVDRFSQVLFSTKGAEREDILRDIDNGVPALQSIKTFIERNG
jgi:conjugal transfer ATP-binding protein TraC